MGAFAIIAVALFLVSLDPLLGAAPDSGPGALERTPPVMVNRLGKGDRLPLHPGLTNGKSNPADWRGLPLPEGMQTQEKTPVGCDPAFSPVSSPAPRTVYGRCIV
jgi:hypothetical protein